MHKLDQRASVCVQCACVSAMWQLYHSRAERNTILSFLSVASIWRNQLCVIPNDNDSHKIHYFDLDGFVNHARFASQYIFIRNEHDAAVMALPDRPAWRRDETLRQRSNHIAARRGMVVKFWYGKTAKFLFAVHRAPPQKWPAMHIPNIHLSKIVPRKLSTLMISETCRDASTYYTRPGLQMLNKNKHRQSWSTRMHRYVRCTYFMVAGLLCAQPFGRRAIHINKYAYTYPLGCTLQSQHNYFTQHTINHTSIYQQTKKLTHTLYYAVINKHSRLIKQGRQVHLL